MVQLADADIVQFLLRQVLGFRRNDQKTLNTFAVVSTMDQKELILALVAVVALVLVYVLVIRKKSGSGSGGGKPQPANLKEAGLTVPAALNLHVEEPEKIPYKEGQKWPDVRGRCGPKGPVALLSPSCVGPNALDSPYIGGGKFKCYNPKTSMYWACTPANKAYAE